MVKGRIAAETLCLGMVGWKIAAGQPRSSDNIWPTLLRQKELKKELKEVE
tara:strand:+ start:137 stop:286 length:150 start_codon:yes stop_codon:yes gene_type:complete